MALNYITRVCTVLFLVFSSAASSGQPLTGATPCSDLNGHWRNQLNSEMNIKFDGPQFSGTYQTGVESKPGAAGDGMITDVVGRLAPGNNGVISFLATWAGGSTTGWVGQCYVSDSGDEYLHTMWLLRSPTNSTNKWMSTLTGQDTFVRFGTNN